MNNPQLSADGRWLVFDSSATNLVADDSNGVTDAFMHDMLRTAGTDVSTNPFVTPEGRYVVFLSRAKNLVGATDTLSWFDVFVTARSP